MRRNGAKSLSGQQSMHSVLFTFSEFYGRLHYWKTSVDGLMNRGAFNACRLMWQQEWKFTTTYYFLIYASLTPGPRHFEPCLATAQGLHRRPATTNTTVPAPKQTSTDKLGLYPGRAPPAKMPTRILTGSTQRSTTETTPATLRPSMVTEGTREMAPDEAQRL